MINNPKCPNAVSHLENAIDRAFPFPVSIPRAPHRLAAHWLAIDADAQAEYENCEGHEDDHWADVLADKAAEYERNSEARFDGL